MSDTAERPKAPRHVAIIMDGHGRGANARGLHRTQGHANGEPVLFDVVHGALDLGIQWLTVYTFSTENWNRDAYEVEFLMQFNVDLLERRRDELNDLGVRVLFAGDMTDERIPPIVLDRMRSAEELTADNTTMTMVFAFNYGGRSEIVDAVRTNRSPRVSVRGIASCGGVAEPESWEVAHRGEGCEEDEIPFRGAA